MQSTFRRRRNKAKQVKRLTIESLEARALLAADLIISEFMAQQQRNPHRRRS